MAMNKAERDEMQRLRERAALNWTVPPKAIDTDIAIAAAAMGNNKSAYDTWLTGWTYRLNSGFGTPGQVLSGGFSSNRNYTSHDGKIRTPEEIRANGMSMSQGRGGPWFATQTDAWLAMRHAYELKAGEALAWIDSMAMEAFTDEAKTR